VRPAQRLDVALVRSGGDDQERVHAPPDERADQLALAVGDPRARTP
jgi:hypothetical protein